MGGNVKNIYVFDFDHTIVDDNSETWIFDIPPVNGVANLPSETKELRAKSGWRTFLNSGLKYLSQFVSGEELKTHLEEMPMTPGLIELITKIGKSSDENEDNVMIILSDSTVEFISWILKKQGLQNHFKHIFSNRLVISETTSKNSSEHMPIASKVNDFHIENYHNQSECKTCPANLCKGQVLKKYLNETSREADTKVNRVFYFADGFNDICPCRKLGAQDVAFVRDGNYSFAKKLAAGLQLECQVLLWNSGHDILNSHLLNL